MKKIYVAAPYSSTDPEIMRFRYEMVTRFAGQLMRAGNIVYSAITHSHPIAKILGNELDQDFWLKQDLEFLSQCDTIAVLKLDGWEKSAGLKKELEYAFDNNLQIEYYEVLFKKVD